MFIEITCTFMVFIILVKDGIPCTAINKYVISQQLPVPFINVFIMICTNIRKTTMSNPYKLFDCSFLSLHNLFNLPLIFLYRGDYKDCGETKKSNQKAYRDWT